MDIKRNTMIQTHDQSVHEYVDLGLPSGTLWATENIKDANGNDLYFAWGETKGYTAEQVRDKEHAFIWNDYKFGHFDVLRKYNDSDYLKVLESVDDVATQNWGAEWKIPTRAQFEELLEGTTQEWKEVNGINGLLCTSKTNDNVVFFAAAGYAEDGGVGGVGDCGGYWSASLNDMSVYGARGFGFDDGGHVLGNNSRYFGYSIRPVRTNKTHRYVDLGLPSGTLWATENIKDANGNDLYFAWGETKGYTAEQVRDKEHAFSWNDYKFGHFDVLRKYNDLDYLKVLESEDDVATQNWGAEWKIPTRAQFEELLAGTTHEWMEVNGVNGLLCISKTNGNTIFFTAAGGAEDGDVYGVGDFGGYWSDSLDGMDVGRARYFYFYDGNPGLFNTIRCYGYSVRTVRV